MKAASTKEIKEELKALSQKEVMDLCLRLVKYKKENKELLSYLLFNAADKQSYIDSIKVEMDEAFDNLPHNSRYLAKKAFRTILRSIARYSRYMGEKEAEVEMRLHFCQNMKKAGLSSHSHQATAKMFTYQLNTIQEMIPALHEDLQYDFQKQFNELTS